MLVVRRIRADEFELNHLLQGGVRMPLQYKGNERIFGLNGLTLIFTAPAGTVTFADAAGAGLTISEIINKITTDVPTLKAMFKDGVIFVLQVTPTAAVVLANTGTANDAFGVPSGAGLTGKFYAKPGGAAPALVSVAETGTRDGFTLVTEE